MNDVLNGPNGCFVMAVGGLVAMYLGHECLKTINKGIDRGYVMHASIGDGVRIQLTPGSDDFYICDNNRYPVLNNYVDSFTVKP